jgi:hypothetical protein
MEVNKLNFILEKSKKKNCKDMHEPKLEVVPLAARSLAGG